MDIHVFVMKLLKYITTYTFMMVNLILIIFGSHQLNHVEQSSFIQIVDMNRFFTGNPVSVRLIDYRKKS